MSSDIEKVARIGKADLAAILADVFAPWVQDLNITIDDLSTHFQLTASFGSVDASFLAAQSDDPRHPFTPARCT